MGIAVGTAVLFGILAGTKVAQDRSSSQAVARIPAAARSVRVAWFGVPSAADESLLRLDSAARRALAGVGLAGPASLVLFRESTVAGHFAGLAAVDGLAPHVRLQTGRLPRPCTPSRCEVLRLRGEGSIPNAPGLRLVQVGTASLRSGVLFGDFLAPTDNALADREVAPALQRAAGYHRPAPAPLLVADGVAALAGSPALTATYRSYAWVWPLRSGAPRLWEIDRLVQRVDRARAELAASSASFAVQAPTEELRAAQRASTVAGRRLLLVGGEAAALLFAFAVLAARGMRRDLEAARRRLTWSGARRWQLGLLAGAESAFVSLAGTVIGWLAGLAACVAAASSAGAPVGEVLRESLLAPPALALAAGVALAAALVILVAVSVHPRSGRRLGLLDAAAVGAVAVVAAALVGGAADEERLASDQGAGLVLLLLPGLIAFAAAVVAARLFGPLVRLAGRAASRRVDLRLAAVSLGRGPGAAAVTVAFLVLAFALALLAEGYRATLARGEADQAAFRVPLDFVVREDLRRLVPVLDAAPLERFGKLGGVAAAVPVLRVRGGAGQAEGVSGVTVLGLPASVVGRLRGWRSSWADVSRATLAADIAPPHPLTLSGIRLSSNDLALEAGPGPLTLVATVVSPRGRYRRVELGRLDAYATRELHATVPPELRHGTLVALELVPPRLQERGADAGQALIGVLRLSGLPLAGWVGEGGVRSRAARDGVQLSFRITPARTARLRAPQTTDDEPPAVLATPRLAELAGGVGGILTLRIAGASVPVRVAEVVERFPGSTGESVVGDAGALEVAINVEAPGAARTSEVWLEVPSGHDEAVAAALARPPFRALESISRRELEAGARNDPLGHGTLFALGAAALVALLLAAVGLALTVRSDLRDDRGELYDLESQGAGPALLRRVVRVRALVVALAGLAGGALAGALLALLVTRVVSVTARTTAPEPPLATTFAAGVVASGAVAYLVLAVLLVGFATHGAFRGGRGPLRGEEMG